MNEKYVIMCDGIVGLKKDGEIQTYISIEEAQTEIDKFSRHFNNTFSIEKLSNIKITQKTII